MEDVHAADNLWLVHAWQAVDCPRDTSGQVDEELKFLLDLVSNRLEHQLAELPGVVGDLRLELDGVLVDALDLLLVEVDLEVVGVELELSAWGLWGSFRLFGE